MTVIMTIMFITLAMLGNLGIAEQMDTSAEQTVETERQTEKADQSQEEGNPAPVEEKPAPEVENPVQDDETPAPEDENPIQDDETPVPEDEEPIQDDEMPAPEDEEPGRDDETPAGDRAFTGSVTVSILNVGNIRYGDQVTLKATVEGAEDIAYTLRWEVDRGEGWETIKGENDTTYAFTVTEQNGGYLWRAVVITET